MRAVTIGGFGQMVDVRRTYHSGFVLAKTFRPMLNLNHARGPAKVKQNYYHI